MRWHRRRRARNDADSDRVAAAEREVELSRRRLQGTHEEVVKPLLDYAEHNNFASIIAASLAQGRGNGAVR